PAGTPATCGAGAFENPGTHRLPHMPMLFTPPTHRTEQPALILAREPGPEFPVQSEHVADDPLRIRPRGKLSQGHIARRLFPTDTGVIPLAGLVPHVLEIPLLLEHARFIGNGPVTRYDSFNI